MDVVHHVIEAAHVHAHRAIVAVTGDGTATDPASWEGDEQRPLMTNTTWACLHGGLEEVEAIPSSLPAPLVAQHVFQSIAEMT